MPAGNKSLISKIFLPQQVRNAFAFKNYSLAKVPYRWLDSFSQSRFSETQNMLIEMS